DLQDDQRAVPHIHHQGGVGGHVAGDDPPAHQVLHRVLEIPAQGPGTVHGVVGGVQDVVLGRLGELHAQPLVGQALVQARHEQVDDVEDVVPGQRLVEHDLV